ncbi:two-component response regulator ARR14-like [Eucalyptus grandis]|uniref:two-component response regulator ARR14-like n=1 Tax=Eucalyptus grandis TaxID=71139 RepID=UPI00192EB596|nr:two-component response regulator ARR14-like [Eucalyptus grandis]
MSPLPNKATAEEANSIKSRVQYTDLVPAGVEVLVVDGDSATLAITSRMLLMFGYKVLTAKSTGDALSIIQERQDSLDLILTEIHLPDADKFEVLDKLGRASNLPVIIMTADNNEGTMLGALLNGASLYLLKPISKIEIRDLWQFSFMRKRDQMAQVTEDSTDQDSPKEEGDDEPESQLPAKQGEALPRKQECKEVDGDKEDDGANLQPHKKTRLTWTNELEEKFLGAIQLLGVDSAQPKKILQLMNVPNLKKASVASHLQGLLSFSESHLQAMAMAKDTRPPSCFQLNPNISPVMACDRDWQPWNYSNQTPNPIANPLLMPSTELSRSFFHTGKEVVGTANVLSIGKGSCSVMETQSSGTGDPPAWKEATVAAQAPERRDVIVRRGERRWSPL